MRLNLLRTCSILLGLLVAGPAGAMSPDEAVRQGNVLYDAGNFDEAQQQYDAAAKVLPDAAAVHFNLGNALFKQQRFDAAVEHYARALTTVAPGPAGLEGRLKYNLGNVAYQRALQALSDAQEALPHLQSAMTYYRDSLEVNPQAAGHSLQSGIGAHAPAAASTTATAICRSLTVGAEPAIRLAAGECARRSAGRGAAGRRAAATRRQRHCSRRQT